MIRVYVHRVIPRQRLPDYYCYSHARDFRACGFREIVLFPYGRYECFYSRREREKKYKECILRRFCYIDCI